VSIAGLLLLSSGGQARGAAPPTAAIQYTAPPECPGASTFLARLEDHTAGAWSVRGGAARADLMVEIRDGTSGKVGSVRRPGRQAEGAREISAADCRDLVEALALSTALSLQESAAPAATVAQVASPPAPSERAVWMAGAGAGATFVFPSQPMPEVSLSVENGRRAWPTGPAVGRPDARLAVAYARNDLADGARARFTFAAARLTLCPASLGLARTAGIRLCAAGEVGVLNGAGVSVTSPSSSRVLWGAAGAEMRLRWAASDRIVVDLVAELAVPLQQATFVFEMPRVEIARVPRLVGSGGAMVGFAFP